MAGVGVALKEELEGQHFNLFSIVPTRTLYSHLILKFRNEYFSKNIVIDEAFGKDVNYFANIDCNLTQGFLKPVVTNMEQIETYNNILLCFN